jgi:hypothetical protein
MKGIQNVFSPKYKNPPIWAKFGFGFQVDFDVGN